jgi:hypothetical protein
MTRFAWLREMVLAAKGMPHGAQNSQTSLDLALPWWGLGEVTDKACR